MFSAKALVPQSPFNVKKPDPTLIPSEFLLLKLRAAQEAKCGRVCVFPSDSKGVKRIFVQHELQIVPIPPDGKWKFRVPEAPGLFDGIEEDRRHVFDCFRTAVLLTTFTDRKDALGAMEWHYDETDKTCFILTGATAGNAESRKHDVLAMLFREVERVARIMGAGSMKCYSETIKEERFKSFGFSRVPGTPSGFTPEYIKGLFPGDLI